VLWWAVWVVWPVGSGLVVVWFFGPGPTACLNRGNFFFLPPSQRTSRAALNSLGRCLERRVIHDFVRPQTLLYHDPYLYYFIEGFSNRRQLPDFNPVTFFSCQPTPLLLRIIRKLLYMSSLSRSRINLEPFTDPSIVFWVYLTLSQFSNHSLGLQESTFVPQLSNFFFEEYDSWA